MEIIFQDGSLTGLWLCVKEKCPTTQAAESEVDASHKAVEKGPLRYDGVTFTNEMGKLSFLAI
jgi:hypothetical protein